MGVYLSTPQMDMESESGRSDRMEYCVGEIQGWRRNMEDAHIACADLKTMSDSLKNNKMSIYGVFDGHGGKEVAKFTQIKFIREFMNSKAFKEERFR